MKVTIFAAGSRGDIQPCVVLARGLQQAGYEVILAAPEDFAKFTQSHGVSFYPLRGDVQKIMASETGRKFMESGGANPLKSISALRTLLEPVVMQMAEDALQACRSAQAVICLGVLSTFGQSIAEALSIPILHIEPTPLLPTRSFPAPSWPMQRNLGSVHNYLSGVLMLQVVWQWYRPFVNRFRRSLGLKVFSPSAFHRCLRKTPMLGAYSSKIIPPPPDWPPHIHITGYLYNDAAPAWQPPLELEKFLEAGEPPVYVGFGSMSGRNPHILAEQMIEALAQSGQRGLLLTGWGGLQLAKVPDNIFLLESAPHAWLFPRMAAVVHHGGAGTTAEGLRSGVPSVVIPFAFDQFFWGVRLKELGLSPDPIPLKRLTARRLAHAIAAAVNDGQMKERAARFGRAIRSENGVENAVNVVRRYFGEP